MLGTVEAARDAAAKNAWREAFELLTSVGEQTTLVPEDLETLGEAGWWIARVDVSVAAREAAFKGYLDAGNRRRAAMVAMAVAKDHFGRGAGAVGSAWIKRAEQALEDEGDCVERGWLERMHSVLAFEGAKDFPSALERATAALRIATLFKDKDLMAMAIQDRGRALLAMGEVEEGWSLIDEATVAAVSGDLSAYTTAVVYCNTITACSLTADFRRAAEWSDAAKKWCDRQSIAGFPGMCRVYRAGIMSMRGDWSDAEREARAACAELEGFNVGYAAEAHYELAELRLRVGDLGAAEESFKQAHRLGRNPQPGLATLWVMQGKVQAAATSLRRAVEDATAELDLARLLPTQVDVALAAGHEEEAAKAAEQLEGIAERFATDVLRAQAFKARGTVELHRGDVAAALRSLTQACKQWRAADAPYEGARTQVLMGRAFSACGDEDSARLEYQAAATTFEKLGATIDLRTTIDLLGDAANIGASTAARTSRAFMFTDIESSTNLLGAIGDEAWHGLVRWHDQTLRSIFASHGGQEVDHAGDGFFVAFEQTESALRCAVEIQRRLAEHRREHGFAPLVRIGVHEAEATSDGGGYKGKGVHEAARIASVAQGGEIVVSESTVEKAPATFTTSSPRDVALKGLEGKRSVVTLEWR
ncbi:MAG: hypothetical protein KY391_08215 [Actinobacteria bacterium]|nr:hypothetical protein [Actinomycetota bacterium]